ncbi:MAG: calcium-binding protein [Actinomycetota bacterium]
MITISRSRALARLSLVIVMCALVYVGLYWATPARATSVEVVTPDNHAEWDIQEGVVCGGTGAETGQVNFVVGPPVPPRGTGSLNFALGPNGNSRVEISTERFAGFNLEEITASDGRLRYWANVQIPGPNQTTQARRAPYLVLDIDRNNDGTQDDSLVYEPRFHNEVEPGVWDQYDVKSSSARWWSTTDREAESGALQNTRQTLTQYRARFPEAEIVTLRIVAGPLENHPQDGCGENDWSGFSGNIDLVWTKIFTNDVMFDFEHEGTRSSPSSGTPVPTPTRTSRSPSPTGSNTTGSPGGSPSESTTSPGPTGGGRCPAEPGQNVVPGTNRSETLRGTRGDDVICAFGGNDVVSGRGGDDEIRLGAGHDRGLGEGGWDDIFGARGRDVIKGGAGNDDLVGGPGRDRCVGGPGRDRFRSCERRLR